MTQIPEPRLARFLFADTRLAWFWVLVRVYVGYQWISAAMDKIGSPAWTGAVAGAGLRGFALGAIGQTKGVHPQVLGWYATLLRGVVVPNAALFAYLVTIGELAAGIALIAGVFTGIAAFGGAFMNMNYMLAGAVTINPVMFVLELFLILAWRVAGYWGVDGRLLPLLGTPWQRGRIFRRRATAVGPAA
ncbi:MAG: DoxX family protein [Candidatus Dormibacteria bacterium]